jgi:ParB family chromosome partitioning protein
MSSLKRAALGQGLGALLPPSRNIDSEKADKEIPIGQLHKNRYQPRKSFDAVAISELAQSLRESGMIQPIIVRPAGAGQYEIIAGERRWRAAQQAGMSKVPVIIREVSDEKALEWALVENLQREDLNPIEEARAIVELQEKFNLTQEQVAQRIGKERVTVANLVRLLNLAPKTLQLVIEKKLSAGHARPLLALDGAQQERLAAALAAAGASAREAERQVKKLMKGPRRLPPPPGADQRAAEMALTRKLGCKVEIHSGKKGGQIVIKYASMDELNRVYAQIVN